MAAALLTVAAALAQPDAALVRQVQQALNRAGYSTLTPDGNWSTATSQALQRFQRAHALEPTGQLDPRTLSALGIRDRAPVSR